MTCDSKCDTGERVWYCQKRKGHKGRCYSEQVISCEWIRKELKQ